MVSMVILNYNDWELTAKYSQTISLMDSVDHIVIVDNCSPDGSYEKLKFISSHKIDVLKTDSNGGYAKGNNYGVQFVIEHYGTDGIIIISNPDIEIEEQAIISLVDALSCDEHLFAVTGLVFNLNNELIPIFTWRLPSATMLFVNSSTILRNILFRLFGYGTKIKKKNIDFRQTLIPCEALPGCFFAAKIDKWRELGGFYEETFLFYEEDILFARAREKQMKMALITTAIIKHLEGVSVKKSLNSWKKRERILQNSCAVYMKVALHKGSGIIALYKGWNQIWFPERYFFYKLKQFK